MLFGPNLDRLFSNKMAWMYRSEDDTRALLRSLQPPLVVQPSSSHGRNDCLTDSILLAMEDQGLIGPLSMDRRVQLCTAVRCHLVRACGLSPHSYPFLSHDEHFAAICQVLRESLLPLWLAQQPPSQTSLTCIVYDRFNRQRVQDANGGYAELVETNPVHSVAPGEESLTAVVTLYCNTHDNGEGWHYEWIRACDEAHPGAGNPAPVAPDQHSSSESQSVGSWIHGSEDDLSGSESRSAASSEDVIPRPPSPPDTRPSDVQEHECLLYAVVSGQTCCQ